MATEIYDFLEKNEDGETKFHQYITTTNNKKFREIASKFHRFSEFDRKNLLESKNKYGQTALHLAVIANNLWQVEQLVKLGADVEARDNDGNTPFLSALQGEHYTVAASLVSERMEAGAKKKGAEWRVFNHENFSFFSHIQMKKNRRKSWLEVHNELKNRQGYCNTHLLCGIGGIEWAKRNDSYIRPGTKTWLPPGFFEVDATAAEYGYLKNEANVMPLAYAALCGHAELARFLLRWEIDVNVPLDDYYLETPLHFAVRFNQPELFAQLLSEKPNLDCQNSEGWTALHYAIQNKNSEMATELLVRGAGVDKQDDKGNTPLHLAVLNQDLDRVHCLLANEANVYHKNEEEKTALELAQELNQAKIAHAIKKRMSSSSVSSSPPPSAPYAENETLSTVSNATGQAQSQALNNLSPEEWEEKIGKKLSDYKLTDKVIVVNKNGGHLLSQTMKDLQAKQREGQKLVFVQAPYDNDCYEPEVFSTKELDEIEEPLVFMEDGHVYIQYLLEEYLESNNNNRIHGTPVSFERCVLVEAFNGLEKFEAFLKAEQCLESLQREKNSTTGACQAICIVDKYVMERSWSPDANYFLRRDQWWKTLKVLSGSSSTTLEMAKVAIQTAHDNIPPGLIRNRFRTRLMMLLNHLNRCESGSLPKCVRETAKFSHEMWSSRIEKGRDLGEMVFPHQLKAKTELFTPTLRMYLGRRQPNKSRTEEDVKSMAEQILKLEAKNNLTRVQKPNKPGGNFY